ncbi:VOC family protein [Saccharibacillus sp. CPCC 101409]|uniref:VOC family protein n=1 Tax=Saccharibacillus sp. CPCC 101409 TaxID=3058041 RepID=UPI002671B15E|nr:VOC family protein [Saccharibacillus sp. CPCC 101409]MDO3410593.1 VOC family protein [Saccharibacillus sp. CPCC 101409]
MNITKIELWISNFDQTVRFYRDTLQFKLLSADARSASFEIGSSLLELHNDPQRQFHYYHFAFNIPPNLFREAKAWLAERVELLTEDGMDEVDFGGITQANSCYLEDPAGNIVEYIARRETTPASPERVFTPGRVSSISEIGLSTDEIGEYAQRIQALGIPVRGSEEVSLTQYLNFMGEYEDGSFIILSPLGRRWYFSSKLAISAPLVIHTDRGIVSSLSTPPVDAKG